MRDYELSYTPIEYYKREKLRKIMLSISIILDFICIALIISAIIMPLYWIGVVILAIGSNAIRYVINIYPKIYRYGIYGDRFKITEVTPLKSRIVVNQDITSILSINTISMDDETIIPTNSVILYDNSCENNAYMIEFSDKRVIIPLDEYLYTRLTSEANEGKINDISR